MDDFLDQILSSSSWSDVNANSRSSWVSSGTTAQTNGLLSDHMGVYEGDEKSSLSPISISASGPIIGNSSFGLNKGLFHGEIQPQGDATDHLSVTHRHDNGSHESKFSLHGVTGSSPTSGPLGLQLNASPPIKLPHGSTQLPESGSGFQLTLVDSHSIPPLWPTSYAGVSTLPPIMGQGKLQGFGLQGDFMESNPNILERTYIGDEELLDNLPTAAEHDELHNPRFPSFAAGPPITLTRTATVLQPHQQSSQSTDANSIKHYTSQSCASQLQSEPATAGGCNGAVKPRVRARRGQATDPHSIAERLRREKIAERMKNLQELVPNSNKTDKASMLDEIIEYVKFLQLQVKVLSMSRLGAAGAVVPLITDVQSEGSSSLLLSPSVGQGADLSESPDSIAFEQEVVKLMESNVTIAMQYLQTKGLCLMPIALAAAISGGKASSNSVSSDTKSPTMTHGLVSANSGPPSSGTHLPSSSNESVTKENVAINGNIEDIATNDCNGAVIKQEAHKPAYDIRELKSKA